MTSTELLLLFSFVSLAPVILFSNLLIQALKGAERVGVESRWGGIGGGGGGWGLTRPATWLLTLFSVAFSGVLISAAAGQAAEAESRRDGLVLEISRRSVASHQAAVEALESASSEPERAAALAQLRLSLASHEAAVSSLETLWGKTAEPASQAPSKATGAEPSEKKAPETSKEEAPAEEPAGEIRDLNPRAVDP